MDLFELSALLITITALFGYVNAKWIKLPTAIGVMLIALLFSLAIAIIEWLGIYPSRALAEKILSGVDFNFTLLHGMLSFLLFAGALHVNLKDLGQQRWVILTLSTLGVLLSTLIIGYGSFFAFNALGFNINLIYCMLFGALISPTDPIAVLSILKSTGAPRALETKITGESLFNDGVGVVIFIVLLGIAQDPQSASFSHIALLFAEEAIGGILFGLVLGYIGFKLLASLDDYSTEVLISLAIVMGGYSLAAAIHTSGPISIVVAGLVIGNHGRQYAMSEKTREHLDLFWKLIDEILNALLFVLIGLEVLILDFDNHSLIAGLLTIMLVLGARLVSVGIPISLFKLRRSFTPYVTRILVWGGLRGGISVALALSLPPGSARDIILAVTYVVVVFSIVVQGLTIGILVEKANRLEAGQTTRIPL